MSKNLQKQLSKLLLISNVPPHIRKRAISKFDAKILHAISEIALNLLQGVIKLTPKQYKALKRYRKQLRVLASRQMPLDKKKKTLVQQGGLAFLPMLLMSVISDLAPKLLGLT